MKCLICNNNRLKLVTKTLRGEVRGSIFYCPRCDLAMLERKIDNIIEYYAKAYRKKHGDNQKITKPEDMFTLQSKFQQQRVKIIQKYFDKRSNFLEVGYSSGQFIVNILDKYKTVTGVELDPECCRYVKEKFKIKVCENELINCGFQDQKFDQIAAFQVLEHTVNPRQFLLDMKKVLKDNGTIFIEVPNLYDPLLVLWPIAAYKKFYYHDAHNFYFSLKSLKFLCQQTGFKIEQYYFLQDYNLFNHLSWYFTQRPQNDCVFGLSEPFINFYQNKQELGSILNRWFVRVDRQYKKYLEEKGMTSNIFLVLKKH